MSNLPCHPAISKFIVLGSVLSVLEETLIMASSLVIGKSIFYTSYGNELACFSEKLKYSRTSGSDLVAVLNV